MFVKDIYTQLEKSITKLSGLSVDDKRELENVLSFGITAIGTLEALVDTVLEPLIKAKNELYKSEDSQKVISYLSEITTGIYNDLDEAQNMVFNFSSLESNFQNEIAPILSKYLEQQEVSEWAQLFNMVGDTRSLSYKRVESLIPKIEDFLDTRYYSQDRINKDLTFKEVKDYLNEIIEEMRATKKDLQLVKSNFLQLSGIKGLTQITQKKISDDDKTGELENVLKNIEDLIGLGRTEIALNKMADLCNYNYPDIHTDIKVLQSQYNISNRNFNLGVDHDTITPNKVSKGILDYINEIRKRENLAE
ncbi:MAG: hypothetical protein JNK77_19805 [Saprospiraceae bacterium]|nr:hypothetical protein [Saprospiraceae bacterium]